MSTFKKYKSFQKTFLNTNPNSRKSFVIEYN
ncbi:hypothetical protein AF80_02055 [Aliarcobacter butzleri L355]|uniref:Uncharacterized protein n=1 Tax=Aliarcobacter butzleri L355 TaxID=1447263 RepID=A0A0G9KXE5_9BACT|nr:hypothetical protein AF80_02055 [Aliarcobacter butzleri L355]